MDHSKLNFFQRGELTWGLFVVLRLRLVDVHLVYKCNLYVSVLLFILVWCQKQHVEFARTVLQNCEQKCKNVFVHLVPLWLQKLRVSCFLSKQSFPEFSVTWRGKTCCQHHWKTYSGPEQRWEVYMSRSHVDNAHNSLPKNGPEWTAVDVFYSAAGGRRWRRSKRQEQTAR